MLLGPLFDRFANESPVSVMVRGSVEYALTATALDELFERRAERLDTRALLFSSLGDLMALVVTGVRKSVHAAYQATAPEVAVSLTAVYNKLSGIEPALSAERVRHTAGRLAPVVQELGGTAAAWLAGYRTRVLDGNHWAATAHRLRETRDNAAAPCRARPWWSTSRPWGWSPTSSPARTAMPRSAACSARSWPPCASATCGWPAATSVSAPSCWRW